MNSDPNSDLNSVQNSALHQVRSCALRAHGVRSRAHTPRSRAQRACWACTGRDTPRQPAPGRDLKTLGRDTQFQQASSRPQIDVATSLCSFHRNAPVATQNLGRDTKPPQGSKNHVATSNRCRDTTQATPGRDLKTGS